MHRTAQPSARTPRGPPRGRLHRPLSVEAISHPIEGQRILHTSYQVRRVLTDPGKQVLS